MQTQLFEDLAPSVGSEAFVPALCERLRDRVFFEKFVVCEYVGGAPVSMLMSEGCRDRADLTEMTKRYLSNHFRRVSAEDRARGPGGGLQVHFAEINEVSLEPRDVASRPHPHALSATIAAIVARRGEVTEGRHLAILMVREGEGGAFDAGEKQFIRDHSDQIAPMIDRHCTIAHPPPCDLERWVEHLMVIHSPLSHREAMVCAYALLGYSNEATALNLGVSVNSAITYRRRAFAKLNIKNQGELFPFLFFPRVGGEALRPPAGQADAAGAVSRTMNG